MKLSDRIEKVWKFNGDVLDEDISFELEVIKAVKVLEEEVEERGKEINYLEVVRTISAEHLAEIKATDDGGSDQPIKDIVAHCLVCLRKVKEDRAQGRVVEVPVIDNYGN